MILLIHNNSTRFPASILLLFKHVAYLLFEYIVYTCSYVFCLNGFGYNTPVLIMWTVFTVLSLSSHSVQHI